MLYFATTVELPGTNAVGANPDTYLLTVSTEVEYSAGNPEMPRVTLSGDG